MAWNKLVNGFRWLFDARRGLRGRLTPRWIFLRALAAIYFSAFYSLLFQIKGLIGPEGILPAQQFLAAVAQQMGITRYWYAPSLYWISASSTALMAVTWIGLLASVIAFLNLWPRLSFFVCFVCFLSFIGVSSVFSSYQSDGMLLEAGFLALFFAPRGLLPGWGASDPPSRASWFLLQWEWFRIYFESGMVKLASGDPEWRNFTAMDEYYQNGPLPTWIGWYAEHLPHWFHAATVAGTLGLELGLVFMMFFPRRVRLICFFIVTPWEIGVILTANYTFLNYLVLSLGFLLLDDKFLLRFVPARFRPREPEPIPAAGAAGRAAAVDSGAWSKPAWRRRKSEPRESGRARTNLLERLGLFLWAAGLAVAAIMLTWIAYDTTAEMIGIPLRRSIPDARYAAHCRARTFSHCEPVRAVCGDDARPLRDRIPGLRTTASELDSVSVPQQAAGVERGPAHLRALSAALRLEPVVCLARRLARERDGSSHRGAAAGWRWRCAGAVPRKSVPADSAALCARGPVAVLVHLDG